MRARAIFSRADDAGRFAVHIEAEEAVQGEISVPGTPVSAVYLPVEREHQCHGVFGHGIGRIGRYPDYRDAVLGGGFQIDVVETAQRRAINRTPMRASSPTVGASAESLTKMQTASAPCARGTLSMFRWLRWYLIRIP